MAKRQAATKTSGRNARSVKGRGRAARQTQAQPVSETQNRIARTGGSDRAMTMSEDREARANAASGHGQVLGRVAATQAQPKLTDKQKEAAKKGTPRPEQKDPQMQVSAPIDHGSLNHTREKAGNQSVRSEVGGQRTEARGSTPWPQNITEMSEQEAAEAIRTTDKADILYKWRNDLRTAEPPRQNLVDLIFEKLLRVQGPPLPQEVL